MNTLVADPLDSLLDEVGDGYAHWPCQATGDDEPIHSLCDTPIRGLRAPPSMPSCQACLELARLQVTVCATHQEPV